MEIAAWSGDPTIMTKHNTQNTQNTTQKEVSLETGGSANIFTRCGRPPCSPHTQVLSGGKKQQNDNILGEGTSHATIATETAQDIGGNQRFQNTEGNTHSPWKQASSSYSEELAQIRKIRELLSDMKRASQKQRNVSQVIKDGIASLEEANDYLREMVEVRMASGEVLHLQNRRKTPRSNKDVQEGSQKRPRTSTTTPEANLDNTVQKKQKQLTESGAWTKVRQNKRDIQRTSAAETPPGTRNSKALESQRTGRNEKSQGRNRRKQVPRARGDVVLIKPAPGSTYAEVLGAFRNKVNPGEAKADIKMIRRTQEGSVLVVLGKSTQDRKAFQDAIQEAIGRAGTVAQRAARRTVEILDLDCITTSDEVKAALRKELGDQLGEVKIKMLGPNKNEQMMALIDMHERDAIRILKKRYLKVGWVRGRVKQRLLVPRCYNCLGYGHEKKVCKGPDRSNLCYRCGINGHRGAQCTEQPRCVLCAQREECIGNLDHVPGSGACKTFRAALEAKKRQESK